MLALIPAAGLGTRMAAVTGGAPKELLPLGRRAVLRRIVDEAIAAGADEVVVVSSPKKPQIEAALADWQSEIQIPLRVAYQQSPRGLGDAIFCAEPEGDTLILLGDCVYDGGSPSDRMATLVYRGIDGCIAVETVPDEEVSRYGICQVDEMGGIRDILEKPQPHETTSRWAVAARYAFTGPVMDHLGEIFSQISAARPVGEISLTDLLRPAIQSGVDLKAVALQPGQARVDCGTPEEYAQALRLSWS
ncbi:sugar phosphate nucleotidyltransferase [Fimbriimonas ginsengisoli]|uniref:UTP--glucose-1-phosphate uridylyltransferase n=1 Tax=Fimbriimonas ginsengisoli Gsoil 348 TaxID=661478 RepID=A0A068NYB8_FIMGI|nr:sugar phosphate nucleotidyltransferase [Fimbriimonas ginsengisoli]AIE87995.1 UTP-glucose-1-phosphate uridylyltransferase [Fimbriimonas ginsengisoli Gsoil 348]